MRQERFIQDSKARYQHTLLGVESLASICGCSLRASIIVSGSQGVDLNQRRCAVFSPAESFWSRSQSQPRSDSIDSVPEHGIGVFDEQLDRDFWRCGHDDERIPESKLLGTFRALTGRLVSCANNDAAYT